MEQAAFPSQLPVAVVPAQVCSNLAGSEEGAMFPKQPGAFVLAGGGERKGKKNRRKSKADGGGGGKDTDEPEKQGVALQSWLLGDGRQGPGLRY